MSSQSSKNKILCLFSDGTWNDLEMKTPSNIFRLSSTLRPRNNAGQSVIAYYDAGIGTAENLSDQFLGGAFGDGIDLNIKQLYTFLAMNYEENDQVCLFGYSRGAYTIRSLAGMISEIGLLPREEINLIDEAYQVYRTKEKSSIENRSLQSSHARKIQIELLVCFDTVGALGIPMSSFPLFGSFINMDRFNFHNTTISEIIQNGIHVLSIDEDRKSFQPTTMTPHPKMKNQVKEIYLPGHHGGIGGGNENEKDCSTIACHWVLNEIKKRKIDLKFDMRLLPDLKEAKRNVKVTQIGRFSPYSVLRTFTGKQPRNIPSINVLDEFVKVLYKRDEDWRPASLEKFKHQLLEE